MLAESRLDIRIHRATKSIDIPEYYTTNRTLLFVSIRATVNEFQLPTSSSLTMNKLDEFLKRAHHPPRANELSSFSKNEKRIGKLLR